MKYTTSFVSVVMAVLALGTALGGCSKKSAGVPEEHKAQQASSASSGEKKDEHKEKEEALKKIKLSPKAVESLRLSYAHPRTEKMHTVLNLPGKVTSIPDKTATIGARVPGRVLKVFVNVGDKVKKNQRLMIIESAEVGKARGDLMAAAARVNAAKQQLDRQRKLLADKVTSQRAVEQAEADLKVAQADLHAAATKLSSYGAPGNVKGGSGSAVLLSSPIDGTVVERNVHVGQWAENSQTLIRVMDLNEVWVLATVYEKQLHDVRAGMEVTVRIDALHDRPFHGKVSYVGETIDERNRGTNVRIVLDNVKRELKPGMFAKVLVKSTGRGEGRAALVIPEAALQHIGDDDYVFVRKGKGEFEPKKVKIGQKVGEELEVIAGVNEKDEIVSKGSLGLKGQVLKAELGEDDG